MAVERKTSDDCIINIFMLNIKDYVLGLQTLQEVGLNVRATWELTIKQFFETYENGENSDQQLIMVVKKQFQKLANLLNTPGKMQILKDPNHRALVLSFMKQNGIEHYKYSYYNRAKVTKTHISRLQKVGPIIFSEAVMLASKINIINKNSSRNFIEDHLYTQSQNPVDMRIQEILKLCDDKKRNINNNLKKLELILEGQDYMEVVKELGKMLRDSWKKDKAKTKCSDFVKMPVKFSRLQNQIQGQQDDNQSNISERKDMREKELAKQDGQMDRFSFTSSQQQLIQQQKQQAKHYEKQELFIYEYDEESYFANRSQLYSKTGQQDFI